MEGVIQRYFEDGRYGFITGEDNNSYFFHACHLDNKRDEAHLSKGLKVQFKDSLSKKGPRAEAIKVLQNSRIFYDPITEPLRTFSIRAGSSLRTYQVSTWRVKARGMTLKEARQKLEERLHKVGANAAFYYKVSGALDGKGLHCVEGVPAQVSHKTIQLSQDGKDIDTKVKSVVRWRFSVYLTLSTALIITSLWVGMYEIPAVAVGMAAALLIKPRWLRRDKKTRRSVDTKKGRE